ncbi:integrase [Mycobacterium adipatum]|jgi:transposase InsO family protein|uniref:Integrase n=1 Tax=Mycobacterium adipatum TaxID=1682113 RepID=A0A172ULC0_9MYCO|nr:integrase core domain-containing protein [Mycobacterium adipatum]ANE79492.1 integrase [Mycobacterium adipatum]ANE79791.1 integrase [Mycobacterium adipatum]ANE81446.1 integrase [Mycobacterium adipatum]
MAQKVTAMDIRMAAALAGQIDNVAEFCRRENISRETFYKWRRRFLQHGLAGLQDLSRRPRRCPGQSSAVVEKLVLDRRQRLLDQGVDHGPESIVWSLRDDSTVDAALVPSRSTVWRILTRHSMITPQPQKRPKSATKRFCFTRPNECWQSDWTQWQLADGTHVAIAGTLDDHSRYLVGLHAATGDADGELVWAVIMAGIWECGIPAMSLTDNGSVYTGRLRGHESAFEINLRTLGTQTINSTPYHPQTCGKIERFWQTLKKWLRAQRAPMTIAELNTLLDAFRDFYNHHRRHRAHRGVTPAAVFSATVSARPAPRPLPGPVFVTCNVVDKKTGRLNVGPYDVNVGLRWAGHQCHAIRDGDHITIFSGNRLVRTLVANPKRRYQPGDKTTRSYRTREPQPAP